MNVHRILLVIAFAAFTVEAVAITAMVGIGGTVEALFANPVTRFVTAEVALCLVMLCVWMARDARQRGISVLPYVALTVMLGGPGALFYFVMHPKHSGEPAQVESLHGADPVQVRA